MMKRLVGAAVLVAAVGAGAFFALTLPNRLGPAAIAAEGAGDAARGETVFWAGGCASCHAAKGAKDDAKLQLAGGAPLVTDVGAFQAPNISPHPSDGIGAWTLQDFANAMQRGIAPDGSHYYPSFPYTSYARMSEGDVADLFAFMKTLPPVEGKAPANDVAFPYNVRRGVGLWKQAFLDAEPVVALPADASDQLKRGQYLVEGPGHCGECHTPRTFGGLGGLDTSRWLAGGPNPDGEGRIPDIRPTQSGIGSWSESDLAYYFETGFTPDFDSVGGSMVSVQENLAKLPASDREAIAAYLKAVPAG